MKNITVTAVTVVYGGRWPLLKQVADAVLKDSRVTSFIISDNGVHDQNAMHAYAIEHPIISIISNGGNIGYSAAINKGLAAAQKTTGDYVFVLDDDCIPEDGYIDLFLANLKLFPNPEKIILAANRENVPGYKDIFYKPIPTNVAVDGTLYEVLSLKKIKIFFSNYIFAKKNISGPFTPIIPNSAFVTGGSLIPMKAVREAPLPDPTLFMYGEDLQYAWGMRKLGYDSYLCYRPIINDIDMTFSVTERNSHIFGLFDPKTPLYKVYLRMRNGVRISRKNTYQSKAMLFINVVLWGLGLALLNIIKHGLTANYFSRLKIIIQGLKDGFNDNGLPENIKLPQ